MPTWARMISCGWVTSMGVSDTDAHLIGNVLLLWRRLLAGRQWQIIGLLMLMMLAAVMEMATLAAALPLIASLIDSQSSSGSLLIGNLNLPEFIRSAADPHSLILGLTVVIVCFSAAVRILVLRWSADFAASVGVELQACYFQYLLHRDYESVINDSSSHNISLVTNKIQIVISNYILGVLNGLTSMVSALGVIVMLVWLSTAVVFQALGLLALAYLLIAWLSRHKLKRYGRDLQIYMPKKIQCVQEALGGFRDVAMGGNQAFYVERLSGIVERVERAMARLHFYNGFARPLIEAIGISSIAVIAWLAHRGSLNYENLLPTLGVFALGMLRLLPFAQQLFAQWARLINGQLALAELMGGLQASSSTYAPGATIPIGIEPELPGGATATKPDAVTSRTLPFAATIALRDVGFSYQGTVYQALHAVSFTINKGDYIGIVGPTGSGKSTLVDILMGLLPPTEGALLIDGIPLTAANRALWRQQVAHVPQKIYLTEGSIASNIAFATHDRHIDQDRVQQCARQACIHDFIQSLPAGYATEVGEDGTRLSGGQRQRLGIARALYSGCKVLVLDEATNALDDTTERAVVEGLLQRSQDYTIIGVTHNLESVKNCHRVLALNSGTAHWLDLPH